MLEKEVSIMTKTNDNPKKGAGIWALLVKFGVKFLGIAAKFTKLIKLGLLVASFAAYAYLFTWKFSVLILAALLWHEFFHILGMKRMGIKTAGIYLIPFVGGAAVAKEPFKTYGQNAFIAIAGPIGGLIMAALVLGAYYITHWPMFAAAAAFISLLNVFNLFFILPLDGGQIVRSIAFSLNKTLGVWFLFVSLLLCVFITIQFKIVLFGIFIVIGALDLGLELYRRKQNRLLEKAYKELDDSYKDYYEKFPDSAVVKDLHANRLPIDHHPAAMNKKQLVYTILSYIATTIALIAIMKLVQHIPGADLAAQFLAD